MYAQYLGYRDLTERWLESCRSVDVLHERAGCFIRCEDVAYGCDFASQGVREYMALPCVLTMIDLSRHHPPVSESTLLYL